MLRDQRLKFAIVFLVTLNIACAFPRSKSMHEEKPGKRALAKDPKLAGEQKKGCTYNDQKISHGTIGYQDICGKFTCTDGFMAWYFFPNAAHFSLCHVPAALEKHNSDHEGMVMDTIPLYNTKSTGEKLERISVIGGPTHGELDHCCADENHHGSPHHALVQTTTIDVKAAHEPHGHPTIEVHNPTTHAGAISVTDHGGHHGEVITHTN